MANIGVIKIAFVAIIISFFSQSKVFSQEAGNLNELIITIQNFETYDQIKFARIDSIRNKLNDTNFNDLEYQYKLNQQLFEEFQVFNRDSAFTYALNIKTISDSIYDKAFLNRAYMNLAEISVSSGMYKECLDYLQLIKLNEISEDFQSSYYGILGRCYGDMAEYSSIPYFSDHYNQLAAQYRAQAFDLAEDGAFMKSFLKAFSKYKEDDFEVAILGFKSLLKTEPGTGGVALINYFLGEIYYKTNETNLAISHYAIATINDVKSSVKESLAIIKLSELLFKKGELENASSLISKAYDDAQFYGAQQRKLQVGAILPLIEEEIVKSIEQEKRSLYLRLILAVVFSIILIGFTSIIFFQYKKLQKARKVITVAHKNLKDVNNKLIQVNSQIMARNNKIEEINRELQEANKVKVEYLGFFFSEYDDVFEKFNEFKSNIDRDLEQEDYDKAKYRLTRYNLKKEKEKLLYNFDNAFISLFPNFINEFNALMKEGYHAKLKENQILNKELRIFALIKLGIKHNEKIAQILNYSVNSIYAYKSNIRNKSKVENEAFDKKLLENTSIKV